MNREEIKTHISRLQTYFNYLGAGGLVCQMAVLAANGNNKLMITAVIIAMLGFGASLGGMVIALTLPKELK